MIEKILLWLKPVVKFIGHIHLPFTRKKMTGDDYYEIVDLLHIGDVLLTSTRGELSNIINPCKIKHGAIYVGLVDNKPMVEEATGAGVVLTNLVSFVTTKDYIEIHRLKTKMPAFSFVQNATSFLHVGYDYAFTSNNKKFYCFELCAALLQQYAFNKIKKVKTFFNKSIYGPESFQDEKLFDLIYKKK